MSSIFNVGLNNDSGNKYSNLTSSVLGSGNSLGDMALIRSGAYKKLLTAYYKNEKSSEAKNTEPDKAEKVKLVTAKSDATKLKESAEALKTSYVSEENRDALKDNLKSFVDSYNALIDSGSAVDNQSVLRNELWMTQMTTKNAGILEDIGIKIGTDNKLSLDEEKFANAQLTTMKTLFNGNDSYMGRVTSRASSIESIAKSEASKGTHASAYTFNGDYESFDVSAAINKLK